MKYRIDTELIKKEKELEKRQKKAVRQVVDLLRKLPTSEDNYSYLVFLKDYIETK